MSSLTAILDAMAAALDDVMGPDALGEDAIQVVPRLNLQPQSPTSVDIYPGDPFRDPESAGFGDLDGLLIFTVRARVNTPDNDGAQDALLALMDDQHALCLAAALEADPTLDGVISQLDVDGNTGFRVFDDPPGAMLGCQWRVRVINTDSEVNPVARNAGAGIVRGPFEFTYQTSGLTTGVSVYTPAVDDILMDAWFEVTTPFNGITPKADISQFTGSGSPFGLFGYLGFPMDLSGDADGIDYGGGPERAPVNNIPAHKRLALNSSSSEEWRMFGRFTSADPLKLVVSQDGKLNGAAIGGTAGAAKLYIVTATPVAFS